MKVTEDTRVKGYSDLEAKETLNMMGTRRELPPFTTMKMRIEEELAACGGSCRAHGNNFYGYGGQVQKMWYLKITKIQIFNSI